MAASHIKTYFNAFRRTYTNSLDVNSIASYDSTNSKVRLNFAIFTPRTELAKLAMRLSYAKLIPNELQSTANALISRLDTSNIEYSRAESEYSIHRLRVESAHIVPPPASTGPAPSVIATSSMGLKGGDQILQFASLQASKGLSAITRAHPISIIPGIGRVPEASTLGLHYEIPEKPKDAIVDALLANSIRSFQIHLQYDQS
ncbi:hypothetical protein DXG01_006128 [Tephrocybe rancida]|nr:hypothetical protein DXG01_006128 [Tephrocybe rancida]